MSDQDAEDFNPYAPPGAAIGHPEAEEFANPPRSEAEAVRSECLADERRIRALGMVNFASTFAVGSAFAFHAYRTLELLPPDVWGGIPYASKVWWISQVFVTSPILIFLHVALGRAFRKLEPWARRWQIGLSSAVLASFIITRVTMPSNLSVVGAVQALAFGVGHIVIIFLLTDSKGARIFSEPYREAIEATPWVGIGIGPSLMAGAIVGGLIAAQGDFSLSFFIARQLATRIMGVHP